MTTLTTPISTGPGPKASDSTPLHPSTVQRVRATRLGFSLDWWSVIAALLLAGLVWAGVLPAINW